MNTEDREDWDLEFMIVLTALDTYERAVAMCDDLYELLPHIHNTENNIHSEYVNFRLKEYDSEGRLVVAEAYKMLGYNPNIRRLK